ncbi:MAG: choice-of-anchor D domain-containing protein [Bacteroidetes bacterium]|nr:choice-of-anchor D domain-containing protein [Bacteroidota bacterium]
MSTDAITILLRRVALATLLLITSACHMLHAQAPDPVMDPSASGMLYYVAFPATVSNTLDSRYPNIRVRPETALFMFSAVKTRVRITGPSYSNVVSLNPGTLTSFDLPANISITTINKASPSVFKVQADDPIVLYCYIADIQSTEAWAPAPVASWGTSYCSASIPGAVVQDIGIAGETEIPTTPKAAPAEIVVLAAYDSTVVTVEPPTGISLVGNPPMTFVLNAGEAFQVQSRVTATQHDTVQDDIAGTRISASHPVGVLSGNTRTQAGPDSAIGGPGLKGNVYRGCLFEWLASVDEYGKHFAYLPTWDNHRAGINSSAERTLEHVRIYNAGKALLTGRYLAANGSGPVPFSVATDSSLLLDVRDDAALQFVTDAPAQLMMHSSAIIKFEGSSPCFRGIPCTDWSGWTPYMVEMTPREQWTTFAPYYAPTNPGNMQHYIGAVTDTVSAKNIVRENGAAFPFTRKIPGTDLIWGSMSVSPGETHWLQGKNGARFAGTVYGFMQGAEAYRPGVIRKKDGGSAIAGGGTRVPGELHPAEYEEYNAVAYGYPLAPCRYVIRTGDTMRIDTSWNCETLTINMHTISANPVGLQSVSFQPGTAVNAMLVGSDPALLSDIPGRTKVTVLVKPIDRRKDASGIVNLMDRTGKTDRVPYVYLHDELATTPANGRLDFGNVLLGSSTPADLTLANNTTHVIHVADLRMVKGLRQFAISTIKPGRPPLDLAPGQSLTLTLLAAPDQRGGIYEDTVLCLFGCDSVQVPVRVVTAVPCVYVGDLAFGAFHSGVTPARTLSLKISNHGNGRMTFRNPVVTFSSPDFSVTQAEKNKLLPPFVLLPGQDATIDVTFQPPAALGVYSTVATFYTDATCDRDTSVWTAEVVQASSVGATLSDAEGYRLEAESHEGRSVVIRYAMPRGVHGSLDVYDAAGKQIAGLAAEIDEGSQSLVWNTAGLAGGTYYCVMTTRGGSRMAPFVVAR